MFSKFKVSVRKLKQKITALYLVYLNKNVPWYKKIPILFVIAYALSPIDLVPDFIPILGMLDDFIIIPFGIWLCMKIIPKDAWSLAQEQAEADVEIPKKYKIVGCIVIITIWLIIITAIALKLFKIY